MWIPSSAKRRLTVLSERTLLNGGPIRIGSERIFTRSIGEGLVIDRYLLGRKGNIRSGSKQSTFTAKVTEKG